jgi:hypothetical protein
MTVDSNHGIGGAALPQACTRSAAKAAAVAALSLIASGALAHHGFGLFDRTKPVELTGTITSIDFVNPHSYLHFDTTDAAGGTIAMRCEMRAATLMRRSGWSEEMFAIGARVSIEGFGHRDDPRACYIEEIQVGDSAKINRNDQFTTSAVDLSNRPLRLASGEPNISGDWAQEQYVIAVPPGGRGGGLVPKSMVAAVESGALAPADVPASGWFARPAQLTERGRTESAAFASVSVADNPRLRCRPTSIVFDWLFDGAVNRITQQADRIVSNYGLYSVERVILMNMYAHPANLTPTYSGHAIGRWDGDVLVVDTVGFEPGLLVAPLRHSDQMHIVERYRLETEPLALVREYVVEDPEYFTAPYTGSDKVIVADVPYVAHRCAELAPEFIPAQ